jgi:hypothetical protein
VDGVVSVTPVTLDMTAKADNGRLDDMLSKAFGER